MSIEDSIWFSALCDLPETFIVFFFEISKEFFLNIIFRKSPVGEKVVFESYEYYLEYFWHCKIDEKIGPISVQVS